MTTLSVRVTEAIETSKVKVAKVAAACGVSDQSVYQWMSGETKTISGEHLVELAAITGFDPRWIAKGLGPKRRQYATTDAEAHVLGVMQSQPKYNSMVVRLVDTVVASDPVDGEDRDAA